MDIKMLIEKLTSQAKLDRQYNGDGKLYDDAADAIAALQAETEEVKRDRDLAINLAETNARLYDGAQEKLKQTLDDHGGRYKKNKKEGSRLPRVEFIIAYLTI